MLTKEIIKAYEDILIEELQPAMGCTEPIAIAYGASILGDALGERPTEIAVGYRIDFEHVTVKIAFVYVGH